MQKSTTRVLFGLSLLSVTSFAAWALAEGAAKDDKAASHEVMKTIVSRAAYDGMMEQMYTQMSATMLQTGGKSVSASKQKALKEAVQECLPYDDLISWSADVYTKHFSRKELDDLAAFYKTPTGKKLAASMPAISGELGAKMAPLMMTRLPAALKKHGLQ
ncbi:MAG TPA: DUF2059 domain-containing protein [Polyangia bacterium]|nr:DUF2059 domain-containing protein [Polyangia bacterium]